MSSPSSPIVVLDSGLGGLTVVRALRRLLPHENILYFGDTARVPYGAKTAATVSGFVRQIIAYLEPYRPKHVVIACNTATALALPQVREQFAHLSITGVVDPGARAAVEAAGDKPSPIIGIIATEATIRSRAYEVAIARRRTRARVLCQATPLLVPIIEDGRTGEDPLVRLALRQYLAPMAKRGMDVLVLGCTHYPIYKDLMVQMLGERVAVIDSADKCAQDVHHRLQVSSLLHAGRPGGGALRCFVTDDPQRFARLAPRFLGFEVAMPTWVRVEELRDPAVAPASKVQVSLHVTPRETAGELRPAVVEV